MSFCTSLRAAVTIACFSLCLVQVHAQMAFERVVVPEPAPQLKTDFRGMHDGDAHFADLNGDGSEDLIITGTTPSGIYDVKLEIYWNDGSGNFEKAVNQGVLEASGGFGSSIVTGDFDGDGTTDILLAGVPRQVGFGTVTYHTELFSNNGTGQFTLLDDSTFAGLADGGVAVADIDDDGTLDVLLFGRDAAFQAKTVLYRNLGSGVFAEELNTGIVNSRLSTAAFADVDGDGDFDFILSGANTAGQPHTFLYLNDGTGTFTQQAPGPFVQVHSGEILFADFNGDGLPEAVLTGNSNTGQRITRLYLNNGGGNFALSPAVFLNVGVGSAIAAADIDSDGDLDLIVAGFPIPGPGKGRIYLNNGSAQFTLAPQQPLFDLERTNLAVSDIDGDGDPDILHQGKTEIGGNSYTSLWVNNGGSLALSSQSPFAGSYEGTCALVDLDNSGSLDIFYSGLNNGSLNSGHQYQNLGGGNFGPSTPLPWASIHDGDLAFADVDGDGDLDVLVAGSLSNALRSTTLYLNNGNGQFTAAAGTPFPALRSSSIAFGDVDGDGDKDVIICGEMQMGITSSITRLYLNDGAGNFTQAPGSFPGLTRADLAFGDLDGDGDLDLVIAGRFTPSFGPVQHITRVYLNNGVGGFTLLSTPQIAGMDNGKIALGDVTGNGNLDLAISTTGVYNVPKLYYNLDTLQFVDSGLFDDLICTNGTVDFADFDGDGDLDMFLTGDQNFENKAYWATIFENDGTGHFTMLSGMPFEGAVEGSVAIGDVDGDGDLDLLYTGRGSNSHVIAHLYLNNSQLGCAVNGGTISTSSPQFNLCIGDGVPNLVQVSVTGNQGLSRFGLVRASNNTIAATNTSGNFNMEDYPAGNYLIGHLSYTSPDQLAGVTQVNQLEGCFQLSNTLLVSTVALDGGTIAALAPTTVCGNDGLPSVIPFSLQGETGPNKKWVVLNNNYTEILAISNNPNFNFDTFGEGIYRVAHAAFANGVNLGTIDLPNLPPCLDASNFVKVTVANCPGIPVLETYPNPAANEAQVRFVPATTGEASLEVIDAVGRRIAVLFQDHATADEDYRFYFQTAHLAPGVYLLRLVQNGQVTTRKIIR